MIRTECRLRPTLVHGSTIWLFQQFQRTLRETCLVLICFLVRRRFTSTKFSLGSIEIDESSKMHPHNPTETPKPPQVNERAITSWQTLYGDQPPEKNETNEPISPKQTLKEAPTNLDSSTATKRKQRHPEPVNSGIIHIPMPRRPAHVSH